VHDELSLAPSVLAGVATSGPARISEACLVGCRLDAVTMTTLGAARQLRWAPADNGWRERRAAPNDDIVAEVVGRG
jgi:hypothetical protein